MTIDTSRKSATAHGLVPLFAIALLVQTPPAGTQRFPSRAEEMKAKQEQTKQKEAEQEAAKKGDVPPKERAKPVDSDAEARATAEKAAHFEKVYRERSARIDRLMAIYKEKGDTAKVAELQAMHDQLEKRHENAMKGFRQDLGEERWAKVEKHWGGPSARALEVRNEHANENAAEHAARKAEKGAEGKTEKPEKPEPPPQKKPGDERPKEKPPGHGGKDR